MKKILPSAIRRAISKLKAAFFVLGRIGDTLDELKINQGRILAEQNRQKVSKNLKDYEFRVFSQWGEDGIIQKLIDSVEIKNNTFIEFGVEDFYESNCRFLMMNDNWSGFVIDGSSAKINRLKNSYFYWKYQLDALDAFVTKDNINELLAKSGFDIDLGILSVDIDGVDYFVLDAIKKYNPRILIVEYNAVFGHNRKITVPYEADFKRTNKHYSDLYFGASLSAMTYLANKRGYILVGTNTAGINAFYVRHDLMNEKLQEFTAENAYTLSKFRESRSAAGNLTHINGLERLQVIKGLPVINVETDAIETL